MDVVIIVSMIRNNEIYVYIIRDKYTNKQNVGKGRLQDVKDGP
jgi:hypothetical protein